MCRSTKLAVTDAGNSCNMCRKIRKNPHWHQSTVELSHYSTERLAITVMKANGLFWVEVSYTLGLNDMKKKTSSHL